MIVFSTNVDFFKKLIENQIIVIILKKKNKIKLY